MKHSAVIVIILFIIIISVYSYSTSRPTQLGAVKKLSRPPKVRLTFSRKIKTKDRIKLSSPDEVIDVLREVWSSQIEVKEEFIVLLLDRRNQIIGYHVISVGGVSGTVVDMKLVLAVALQSLASSIIVAHNHPSGNTEPSYPDLKLTEKLVSAAKLHDIEVLDHIILTKEDYYSFKDEGRL